MPNYAPLPLIELDPRTESQLVAAAAQRVYEASGATINDFSSGSPIVALLEGQAYAQAEFLQFANQFPEAVLVEWIGPFLGAQRRTGSGSVVNIEFTISPRGQEFEVFAGFQLATDSNLTGGESILFVTTEPLVIPAGESTGTVQAVSQFRGINTNVAANTITSAVTSLSGVVSVINPEPATGGQDPELLSEVKERFFTLIRRRNPVSAEDWVDFFSDALGPGAAVNVLPRRSEKEVYRYDADFIRSNPSVAFFVLNPDGTPLTQAQRDLLQNLIRWSLPIEFTGTVYSMEVDDADVDISLEYDPKKPYAANLKTLSKNIRDSLFGIMTPNAVYPVSYSPNVSDISSALTSSFPTVLGSTSQYIDPDIANIKVYHTPKNISTAAFTVGAPKPFKTGASIKLNDLVADSTGVETLYYPTLQDFTPVTGDKSYHANIGDLKLSLIRALEPGIYSVGDVISVIEESTATLHVALTEFSYNGSATPAQLISQGYVSEAKGYSDFTLGGQFTALNSSGEYDPQIIAFDSDDLDFEVYLPPLPVAIPQTYRPGTPVWVVVKTFTRTQDTTNLGVAQTKGYVAEDAVEIEEIEIGGSYAIGEYVMTPDPTVVLTANIANSCYLDKSRGAVRVVSRVLKSFTFRKRSDEDFKAVYDALVADGYLDVVEIIPFIDCAGRANFSEHPFRYKTRFSIGEYLRYRPEGGFDAAALEECFRQSKTCSNVTPSCKRLLEDNLPLPRYFLATKDFTPSNTDPDALVRAGLLIEVDNGVFYANYIVSVTNDQPSFSSPEITNLLITQRQIETINDLSVGNTTEIQLISGKTLYVYYWTGSAWDLQSEGLPTFRDIFRFAPKDSASFRSGSEIRQYEATKHITPLVELEVYYDARIFVRSERTETVKYFDSSYNYEDVIYNITSSSVSFYRVERPFTPPTEKDTWAGVVPNTPRIEEVEGNLLKFVVKAEDSERVFPRLGAQVGAIKLGTATVRLEAKSTGGGTGTFVWESTASATQTPTLSYSSATPTGGNLVSYGDGTLSL